MTGDWGVTMRPKGRVVDNWGVEEAGKIAFSGSDGEKIVLVILSTIFPLIAYLDLLVLSILLKWKGEVQANPL